MIAMSAGSSPPAAARPARLPARCEDVCRTLERLALEAQQRRPRESERDAARRAQAAPPRRPLLLEARTGPHAVAAIRSCGPEAMRCDGCDDPQRASRSDDGIGAPGRDGLVQPVQAGHNRAERRRISCVTGAPGQPPVRERDEMWLAAESACTADECIDLRAPTAAEAWILSEHDEVGHRRSMRR